MNRTHSRVLEKKKVNKTINTNKLWSVDSSIISIISFGPAFAELRLGLDLLVTGIVCFSFFFVYFFSFLATCARLI